MMLVRDTGIEPGSYGCITYTVSGIQHDPLRG